MPINTAHLGTDVSVPLKTNPNYRRRRLLLIFSYFFLFIASVFMYVNVFHTHYYLLAGMEAIAFFFILYSLISYYKSSDLDKAIQRFTFFVFLFTFSYLFVSHKENYSLVWIYFVPVVMFFLFGTRKGIYIVIGYALIIFAYLLYESYALVITGVSVVNIMTSFIVLTGSTFYYEYSREEVFIELEKVLEREKLISVTDVVTTLYNRGKIDTILAREFQLAHRHNEPFSIIMIDIDHFKRVNDTFGHQVGDIVLVEIAQMIKSTIRKTDYVGRWGGEEFMLVLPKTSLEDANTIAQGLCANVATHEFTKVNSVTLSFGVATFGVFDTLNTLIKRSDECLYLAKDMGRNQVVTQDILHTI